jgi:hypothetical protein
VADAALVETSFRDKLAAIQPASAVGESRSADAEGLSDEPIAHTAPTSSGEPFLMATEASTPTPIVLPGKPRPRRVAAKTIRLRDKEHCKFVTRQPCVVCGRTPSEARHIRFAQPRALGRKVSPVCRLHHRELHRYGDEASWWAAVSIDPLPIALSLLAHPSGRVWLTLRFRLRRAHLGRADRWSPHRYPRCTSGTHTGIRLRFAIDFKCCYAARGKRSLRLFPRVAVVHSANATPNRSRAGRSAEPTGFRRAHR